MSDDKTERPNDLQEWIWHMDLHLTEHDERHAGLALRAAWPAVRAYLCSVENERNTWRELAKKAESAPSAIPQGWKLVPIEPTEEMRIAGAAHTWSGGYDRNGSHASGKYEEYTEGLQYVFGDHSSPFAAGEVYEAMVRVAPKPESAYVVSSSEEKNNDA